MTPPRHTARPGPAAGDGATDPRSGARGTAGPPRRPTTNRPPDPDPARQAALDLLAAVRDRGAYANLALGPILREADLHGRDAALATELAYGSLPHAGPTRCRDRRLRATARWPNSTARWWTRCDSGAYQLLHTRIPCTRPCPRRSTWCGPGRWARPPDTSTRCSAASPRPTWTRGWNGWPTPTTRSGSLALATAHPRWIVLAIADALGVAPESAGSSEDLVAALTADDAAPHVHLVARPGRIDRDELVSQSGGTPGRYSPYAVYLNRGDPGRIPAIGGPPRGGAGRGFAARGHGVAGRRRWTGTTARWLDLAAGPGGKAGLIGAAAARARCPAGRSRTVAAPGGTGPDHHGRASGAGARRRRSSARPAGGRRTTGCCWTHHAPASARCADDLRRGGGGRRRTSRRW